MWIFVLIIRLLQIIFIETKNEGISQKDQQNISIHNFHGSIKWSDKILSISWNIGDKYKNAILFYIVKILDESNNICFNTFAYKCEQCSRIHNNIDENYLKNMPIFSGNCRNKIETFELFKGDEIKFQRNKTINTENEIFNIEIYGVNLGGLHKILNQPIEASPSKPAPPEDIIPIDIASSYIHLSWPASIKNSANSAAKGYSILQSNNNNNNKKQNTTNTKIKINNLKQCTKYCFIIYSYNTAGMSQPSKEKCFHTKSPKLSNIILSNISSEYRAIRNISWRYLGKEICPIKYQIKYSNDNIQQNNYANNQFYELTNLNLNDIYWINVRLISELETDDGGIEGPWSNKVTFYTGLEQPKLMNFKENYNFNDETFDIFLSVNTSLNQKILGYLIMVKNDTNDNNNNNNCHLMIVLQCEACQNSGFNEKIFEEKFQQITSSTNCSSKYESSFLHQFPNITTSIKEKLPMGKYIVEYYGYNLLGFHHINKTANEVKKPVSAPLYVEIIVSILSFIGFGFLYFGLLMFRKRKRINKKKIINIDQIYESINFKPLSINENINKNIESIDPISESIYFNTLSINENANKTIKKEKYQIKIEECERIYENVKSKNQSKLIKEYENLCEVAINLVNNLQLSTLCGENCEVSNKNAISNVVPFDQNRVIVGKEGYPNDYINASFIPFIQNEKKYEYIAAQTPNINSLSNFWQMIWDEKIHYIVMTTDISENPLKYWPINIGDAISVGQSKQLYVILTEENRLSSHIEKCFIIKHEKLSTVRKIVHFDKHFDMKDSSINYDNFNQFLLRFHEITHDNKDYPLLIHCINGAGASGTLISIDRIIKQLLNGYKPIDIYKIVLELRQNRKFIVQTYNQYVFIYQFINYFLSKYSMIKELSED